MQQQMQRAFAQIPEDIARLAHEQQLGTPQGSYTVSKLSRGWRWLRFAMPLSFLLLICIIIALISVIIIDPAHILLILLLLGIVYVLFLTLLITAVTTNQASSIYSCDKGFILKQSNTKFRVVRWNEIETIWYTSTRTATRFYFKSRRYTLRCHDGYTLTFNNQYSPRNQSNALDKAFSEQFTRRRLPFQFANYQAGQMLSFGPLSINREGVCASGKMLPWEQVATLSLLKDRRLVIYKTGERPEIWLNLPAFKIPNLSILLALFKRIRSGQSEQEIGFELLTSYGTTATIVQSRGKVDALPDGLSMLAEEHQLGERRLDQELGRSRLASWTSIIVSTIIGIMLAVGVTIGGLLNLSMLIPNGHSPTNPGLFLEIGLLCLMYTYILTRNIVRNLQQIHNYTYTFEHGILLKRGQQAPIIYHWEDIEIIWRNSSANWYTRRQQAPAQSLYAHTIQLRNSEKYTLTYLNIKQEALGTIIKEQIVPRQIPAITTAFQAGQTITFGTIQMNHEGITVGKRILPWSQIKSVALLGSQLVIYDITQRKPWCRLPTENIPNLFLLFALADYARDIAEQ